MKTHFITIATLLIQFLACKQPATAPTSEDYPGPNHTNGSYAIVEGTFLYFEGGGTIEMPYPPGYCLQRVEWISQEPDSAYGFLYLEGRIDSSATDKRIRANGPFTILPIGSFWGYTYSALYIQVDSMRIIQ